MNIEINIKPFQLDTYGFGGIAANKDYSGTVFKLSGRMWEVVKVHGLKNKGKNIWVYDVADWVFAGVELEQPLGNNYGLERKSLNLEKYSHYRHVGSYALIKQAGQGMTNELIKRGFEVVLPYVEVYGHWDKDERKLETELFMCLK